MRTPYLPSNLIKHLIALIIKHFKSRSWKILSWITYPKSHRKLLKSQNTTTLPHKMMPQKYKLVHNIA